MKPDIRLLAAVDTRDSCMPDHFGLTLTVHYMTEQGQLRNINDSPWSSDQPARIYPLADLALTAQTHRGNRTLYAWRYSYHRPHSVELPRAEVMVKTLRSIARKLKQHEERFGSPTDFAAYVGVISAAIGVTTPFFIGHATAQRGWSHDEMDYRYMDVDVFRYWVERQIVDRFGKVV